MFFSPERTKAVVKGKVHMKETGVNRSISEGFLTTSFGAGGGGSLKIFFKNLPKLAGALAMFSSD